MMNRIMHMFMISEVGICCGEEERGKGKQEIKSKERLQQLLTKHDMRMSTESSFTYADILQRIFQRWAEL